MVKKVKVSGITPEQRRAALEVHAVDMDSGADYKPVCGEISDAERSRLLEVEAEHRRKRDEQGGAPDIADSGAVG